jgi:hypothetical protein
MKYTVEIPEYLSIGEYQRLSSLEHLTDLEKTMEIVHTVTTIDKDVLSKWTPNQLSNIGESVLALMNFDSATFYPIIEFNDVLYGYRPISKMILGEYIDLERLCKEPNANLHEIVAILYRPITKDKTQSLKFKLVNGHKIAKGTAENLFKYYDIEDYNSNDRGVNAENMLTFPVSFALGAMSFFLGVGTKLSSSINKYLRPTEKMMITEEMNNLILSIGDGLGQYIHSQNPISYQSLETRVSLS